MRIEVVAMERHDDDDDDDSSAWRKENERKKGKRTFYAVYCEGKIENKINLFLMLSRKRNIAMNEK